MSTRCEYGALPCEFFDRRVIIGIDCITSGSAVLMFTRPRVARPA